MAGHENAHHPRLARSALCRGCESGSRCNLKKRAAANLSHYWISLSTVRMSSEPGPSWTERSELLILALQPGPPSGSSFTLGMRTTIPGCTVGGRAPELRLSSRPFEQLTAL